MRGNICNEKVNRKNNSKSKENTTFLEGKIRFIDSDLKAPNCL